MAKRLKKPTTTQVLAGVGAALDAVSVRTAPPSLPTERKPPMLDLSRYTILVYGREKIGKTTLFSSFPDAIFFATEPGTKGLEIYEYNHENGGCRNWGDMLNGLRALEESPGQFKTAIVDTGDRAYDFCRDWVCEKRGVEYPSDKNDYGGTWNAVKMEFLSFIHRIERTGRGLCFTSHLREVDIQVGGRTVTTKVIPSMSNQARGVIEAVVDLFFYAEYIRMNDGDVKRVLITRGNDYIWGGSRKGPGKMPLFVPLLEEGGYEVLKAAFEGEDVGINPQNVLPVASASDAAKRAVTTIKAGV